MIDALIIGAGPAGLMAAEVLSREGVSVVVADVKPSVGRKFLMAGKSGLNLTKNEAFDPFVANYFEAAERLRPALSQFTPQDVQRWAQGLGQEVFTGSSGRVFPKAMKGSPLLRAWLARLDRQGVQIRTRWRLLRCTENGWVFDTPSGEQIIESKVTILAMGGASWARLGSDGAWADLFDKTVLSPFQPANVGIVCAWSSYMIPHFGTPLKNISLSCRGMTSTGECVVSRTGLEGSGIYALSRETRAHKALVVDLLPNKTLNQIAAKLQAGGKASTSNRLRRLGLDPLKIALLNEVSRPLPNGPELAALIKAMPLPYQKVGPLDEAISVAGGIRLDALDKNFMLKHWPNVFCAGEMLDWEAPTGGYLLNACFATGKAAAMGALQRLNA